VGGGRWWPILTLIVRMEFEGFAPVVDPHEVRQIVHAGASMPMRKMEQSEAWAKDYLLRRGFKAEDLVFEPDGNVPPDFLIEDRIAVGVRRLNQQWQAALGDLEPVEKFSTSLLIRLRKLLDSFRPPSNGVSWYVFHRFERPQLTKNWEPILRRELQPLQDGQIQDRERTIHIDAHFNVRLVRRAAPGSSTFIWGRGSDFDNGGWVIPELEKNLAICIDDKSKKIADYRKKYPEWWLDLVDHMMGGTPEAVQVEHDWNRVLIIHPSDWGWAYEVGNS
jgi:hypothetical protein